MEIAVSRVPKTSPLSVTAGRFVERLRLAYQVTFRSQWRRLTWLVSAALFLLILLLTGAIATLPAPTQFPFPRAPYNSRG